MALGLAIALALVALAAWRGHRLAGWQSRRSGRVRAGSAIRRAAETARCRRPASATRPIALRAALEADARNFDARMNELREAKEALSAQFSEIGNKLLGEAQEAFLKRADQRFKESEDNIGPETVGLAPAGPRAP